MLVSSITSVLVSPTLLNTPGILFLLVLPRGERNYCQAGLLQIAAGGLGVTVESQPSCHFAMQSVIFPAGLTKANPNIYRYTFLNPHRSHHLYPAEADVKHSWHRAGWHSRASVAERKWKGKWDNSGLRRCLGTTSPHVGGSTVVIRLLIFCIFLILNKCHEKTKPNNEIANITSTVCVKPDISESSVPWGATLVWKLLKKTSVRQHHSLPWTWALSFSESVSHTPSCCCKYSVEPNLY